MAKQPIFDAGQLAEFMVATEGEIERFETGSDRSLIVAERYLRLYCQGVDPIDREEQSNVAVQVALLGLRLHIYQNAEADELAVSTAEAIVLSKPLLGRTRRSSEEERESFTRLVKQTRSSACVHLLKGLRTLCRDWETSGASRIAARAALQLIQQAADRQSRFCKWIIAQSMTKKASGKARSADSTAPATHGRESIRGRIDGVLTSEVAGTNGLSDLDEEALARVVDSLVSALTSGAPQPPSSNPEKESTDGDSPHRSGPVRQRLHRSHMPKLVPFTLDGSTEETAWGAGLAQLVLLRKFGPLLVAIAILLLGGYWMVSANSSIVIADDTDDIEQPMLQVEAMENLGIAGETLHAFHAASTAEEKAKFVRNGELLVSEMEDYYQKWGAEPQGLEIGKQYETCSIQGRDLLFGKGSYDDGKPFEFLMEKSSVGWKLDWRFWAGTGDMEWSAFVDNQVSEPTNFRLLASRDDYFSGKYTSEKYYSIQLRDKRDQRTCYGYVGRSTPAGRLLDAYLPKDGSAKRITLQLVFEAESKLGNQALITYVHNCEWIDMSL